jgi:hypothetical protein
MATAAPKRPPGPGRSLVTLLWRQPLMAIPFAVFFGLLNGRGDWSSFRIAYLIALVFSLAIGLSLWGLEHFLMPRVMKRTDPASDARRLPLQIGLYAGVSIVGSVVSALIVHFTIFPMLGSARAVMTFAMFSLIFCALFLGIFTALSFYQRVIDQAKSEQELHLARRIQRSFLISQFPEMPRLEVHAVNVSSKQVSGDFYDVVPAGENAFLVAIADVAGKGVPAALLSSMLQASLRTQASSQASVGAILETINGLVFRSTAVHQFATFFLARVEEDTLRLTSSNAGHNFPVLFRKSGERVTLERGGTVVGIMDGARFEEETVALTPGDRVLLYTDGINEAENAAGEMYGDDRLIDLVSSLPHDLSARETTERILAGVRQFLGEVEPGDDMTVMMLRVLEGAPSRDGEARRPAPLEAAARPAAARQGA